jgi:hypothetical protein
MDCHVSKSSYVGQIGDPGVDHAYWGRPEVCQGLFHGWLVQLCHDVVS